MKPKILSFFAFACLAASIHAAPLGSAFTYQGYFTDGGQPATGTYDFQFHLYDGALGGLPSGLSLVPALTVSNGLFTATLDFGPSAFTGQARWLSISIRTNGSVGAYTTLAPRQSVLATPYALFSAGSGSVANNSIAAPQLNTPGAPTSGQVLTYNGSSLSWQNPSATSGSWAVGGNNAVGGNFLGTLNNLSLDLRVNNSRALRLEPNATSPNVIAGWFGNIASSGIAGGTIGGGGAEFTFGRPSANKVTDDFCTVSGGANNIAGSDNASSTDGYYATVGGGQFNRAEGVASTIGGGSENRTSNNDAAIGGGWLNSASGMRSSIAGGYYNIASGDYSAIPGGYANTAAGLFSFAGGKWAGALDAGCFVWNDSTAFEPHPVILPDFGFDWVYDNETTGPNQFRVKAGGGVFINSDPGIRLNAADTPLITRGFDPFGAAAGPNKTGHGRWGLFMEPGNLNIGIPELQNRGFEVSRYRTDGTRTMLMRIDQDGQYLWFRGAGQEDVYIGGDGVANDAQIGSLNPTVENLVVYNPNRGQLMNVFVRTLTITGGADLAEPFRISSTNVPKGSVVIIDENNPGHLKMSERAYDTRVAGIVSGGNGVNSGITMHQQGLIEGSDNIALSGRVYVQADASTESIKPGDLLTTSDLPGHAMKVTDHGRAQGAILGKAMSGLAEGKGMVLVLVTLQ